MKHSALSVSMIGAALAMSLPIEDPMDSLLRQAGYGRAPSLNYRRGTKKAPARARRAKANAVKKDKRRQRAKAKRK